MVQTLKKKSCLFSILITCVGLFAQAIKRLNHYKVQNYQSNVLLHNSSMSDWDLAPYSQTGKWVELYFRSTCTSLHGQKQLYFIFYSKFLSSARLLVCFTSWIIFSFILLTKYHNFARYCRSVEHMRDTSDVTYPPILWSVNALEYVKEKWGSSDGAWNEQCCQLHDKQVT